MNTIERILDLHQPRKWHSPGGEVITRHAYTGLEADKAVDSTCDHCGVWYPCATAKIIQEGGQ